MNRKYIVFAVSTIIFIVILFYFNRSKKETASEIQPIEKTENTKNAEPDTSSYAIKIIHADDLGWGYDILKNDKLFIHQPTIPSVAGNNGFKTEEDAQKTAACMLDKLRRNIFPPSISRSDLDSMKISGI